MDLYSEIILDHGKNPRNTGNLLDYTHQSKENNELCGDECEIKLKVQNGKCTIIKHQTKGCLICVASASILCEKLVGKSTIEIEKMTIEDVLTLFRVELTTSRLKCALTPFLAIKRAII